MILVTGGAGFIGSNIVADLLSYGEEVIVCDRLGGDNVKWHNLRKHLIERIVAPENLSSFLKTTKVTAIVHMGAISATTVTDADEVVRTNVDLSCCLWEHCARTNIPFLYASSAATYGDGKQGFDDDNDIDKMQRLRPLNLYGWSKHWFDLWVLNAVRRGRRAPPRWAGLKFFNVYGPNELHKRDMMSIVSKNYQHCRNGDEVQLFKSHNPDYADGGQLRDFVYVADCVRVVRWLLRNTIDNGIFNVGSGSARSFRDMMETAYTAAGKKTNIKYVSMPDTLQGRYQYFTEAKLDKLRAAGYSTKMTPLEDGVTELMQKYLLTDDLNR